MGRKRDLAEGAAKSLNMALSVTYITDKTYSISIYRRLYRSWMKSCGISVITHCSSSASEVTTVKLLLVTHPNTPKISLKFVHPFYVIVRTYRSTKAKHHW